MKHLKPPMHQTGRTISNRPEILRLLPLVAATLLTPLTGIQTACAELPALTEKPWSDQFAVFKNRNYQLSISKNGEIRLAPLNKKGEMIGDYIVIPIQIGLEETLPGGRTRLLGILPETLESSDPATDKLKNTVIRGKVTGGAAFEATIEESRGIVSIGGRVTDPGTTTRNPLGFSVFTRIPYFFGHVEKDTPAKLKEFEESIKNDYIQMKWINGKRHKELLTASVDAGSPEMSGPGIASAELGLTAFQKNTFLMSASENTSLRIANARSPANRSTKTGSPLYEGLLIHWTADAAKDPRGRARLAFEVK